MNFELIIWKKLRGEISAAEEEMLTQWLHESEENRVIARQIETIWQESRAAQSLPVWDVESEFQALQARIARSESRSSEGLRARRGGKFSAWKIAVSAAAALALLITGWKYITQSHKAANWQDIIAQQDAEQLLLPDGTQIWLRKGCKLSYPQTFGVKREVRLNGEAFFEVAHQPAHPFLVHVAEGTQVEVLGTAFDISPRSDVTRVYVQSGKVRVSHPDIPQTAIVQAGQQSVLMKRTGQMIAQPILNENHLAWKTGELQFKNQPLRQVLAELEWYYNIQVNVQNSSLMDCRFTGTFDGHSAEIILQNISIVFGARLVHLSHGNYQLTGGHCRQPK